MAIFTGLREKPWLSQTPDLASAANNSATRNPGKTALKFFLAVVSMLFFLFIITFLSRTQFADFQALTGKPWLPLENSTQLWINTGYILLASVCFQISSAFKQVNYPTKLLMITLAIVFSVLFVFGQLGVWQTLAADGYLINTNPANSFFYLLTGLHVIHLLGGVLALLRLLFRLALTTNHQQFDANLKLVTFYWHYLIIVWLVLFALLTSSTETFKTIAQLCGF